jgi:ammonium transporter Rh
MHTIELKEPKQRVLLAGTAFVTTVAILLAVIKAFVTPTYTNGTYLHKLVGMAREVEILETVNSLWIMLCGLTTLFMLILVAFFIGWLKNYEWTTFVVAFLAAAICIPLYAFIYEFFLGTPMRPQVFYLAVVCAITGIIAWAVPLGRGSLVQASVFYVIFTLFYILNEYSLYIGWGAADPGGSLLVHVFAAYFGMGFVLKGLHTKAEDYKVPWEMTKWSMTMCLMGAGLLWPCWSYFVGALMGPYVFPRGAWNVTFAICGSVISCIALSRAYRGKPSIIDICWSMLAGGVAIGATANIATIWEAFLIGLIAGGITCTGFAKVWEPFNKKIGIDVCGVQFLHGWAGIFGGIVAASLLVGIRAPELWTVGKWATGVMSQIAGGLSTIAIALIGGVVAGVICLAFKRPEPIYSDKPILLEAEPISE